MRKNYDSKTFREHLRFKKDGMLKKLKEKIQVISAEDRRVLKGITKKVKYFNTQLYYNFNGLCAMDNSTETVDQKVKQFCSILKQKTKTEKNPLQKRFLNKEIAATPLPTEEDFI